MKKQFQTRFILGEWQVSPPEGVLMRGDETVRLEPKVMEVLVYFSTHPDIVISREELEREVWHGAIVGYDAVTATVIKLRKALHDQARQPRYIMTIPKKGYKLIAPIQIFDGQHELPVVSIENSERSGSPVTRPIPGLYLGGLILFMSVLAFGLGWYYLAPGNTISATPVNNIAGLPTIIVLPFETPGNSPTSSNFVDGITEDVITDLSRLSRLNVISSTTSFRYKGQDVSFRDVSKDLHVDYVMKGSIRRNGENIRINVQLVDAKTGFNVWAERYDRNINDVFAIQKQMTQQLVDKLAVKLTSQEKISLGKVSTANLQAYDFFLQGQKVSRERTRQSNELAKESYRHAIETDPAFGRAYGALAFSLAIDYRRGWTDAPVETMERALVLARKGVALNSDIPQTYWVLGYVHMIRKEFDKAEEEISKAIRIAPNYADGYGLLALINNNLGRPKKAIEYITRGMRLNPYYSWDYPYNLGRAYYALGQYKRAVRILEKVRERNENTLPPKLFLIASYVNADRIDDAQWEAEQLQLLSPEITITHMKKSMPIVEAGLRKKFFSDLRIAGISP